MALLAKCGFSLIWRGISSSSQLTRFLSTGNILCDDRESWLSKLVKARKIEPHKESHSRMLSDKEVIYELHTHNVKPDGMSSYLKKYEEFVGVVTSRKDTELELVGSWTVDVGDQDQAIHLWRYTGGYASVGQASELFRNDQQYRKLIGERLQYLRSRHCQYFLSFSFWNAPASRTAKNIYEIRSYILKPGTMIEWGNNWARAIHYRQNNEEAFCGLFSQVGRLYNVHHFWVYKDLLTRKETRESAWQKPGWDECVAYTVPLIKEMEAKIMVPTNFSPTK